MLNLCLSLAVLVAQAASPSATSSLVGEVTAVAADGISVRSDAGAVVAVSLGERAVVLRSRPGATSLADAVPINLSEVASGDRVLARGTLGAEGKSFAALRLVVMKHADIEAKREKEQSEWRRRGIGGVIATLDPSTRQMTLRLRGGNGGQAPATVLVPTADVSVAFRRYAADSVSFSEARPSSFADLTVGDQVRVLGQRSEDGGTVVPEQIVSGAFRTVQGQIASLDAERRELKLRISPEGSRAASVTVSVGPQALVRKLPAGFGSGMAVGGPTRNGASREGGPREPGGMRRGGLDEMFERLPPASLAEFKPGEEVAILGTRSADPARMTAMKVLGGLPVVQSSRGGERGGRRGGGGMEGGDSPDDTFGFGGDVPW